MSSRISGFHAAGPSDLSVMATGGSLYYRLPNATLTTSAALGNGTLRVTPKFIPNTVTLDRIGAEVSTIGEAGSKVRLGIYADNGSFRPGALVLDAGQIAGDSATVQQITISQVLTRGWYWFGGAVQSAPTTQPTLRVINVPAESVPTDYMTTIPGAAAAAFGFFASGATAALPGTFTVAGASSTIISVFGRVV